MIFMSLIDGQLAMLFQMPYATACLETHGFYL